MARNQSAEENRTVVLVCLRPDQGKMAGFIQTDLGSSSIYPLFTDYAAAEELKFYLEVPPSSFAEQSASEDIG
ncbi:hypothetical protein GUJ93_ZPchr0011g27592 [Zizania palustris]|uniref:Uncharacterized protein n=1 Tax=Zizania palustris TaxID=103762 RepID=A0A8J5WLV3_ZIZPA|nr:hypothetical protein GUJ93_ZPchr0011g27592 [Zizania palustris]